MRNVQIARSQLYSSVSLRLTIYFSSRSLLLGKPVPVHSKSNTRIILTLILLTSGVPRIFFGGGGVQQIQLRTEDRDDGDLGAVAP